MHSTRGRWIAYSMLQALAYKNHPLLILGTNAF